MTSYMKLILVSKPADKILLKFISKLSRSIQRWRPNLTYSLWKTILTQQAISTSSKAFTKQCRLKKAKGVEVEVVNKIKEKEQKASSMKRNLQ